MLNSVFFVYSRRKCSYECLAIFSELCACVGLAVGVVCARESCVFVYLFVCRAAVIG